MSMDDHSGKAVLVVGGTSGINLGIALAFARAGAHVAVVSRSPDKVAAAVQQLRTLAAPGARMEGFSADVRDAPAVAAVLAQVHAALGDLDVLVSGAAGNFVAPALGMSPNAFRTVVDIDLNGSFNVLRQAHPYLRKPGASLISISASQSYTPTKYQAHVCAAKAGVDMLTRVLALEWRPTASASTPSCPARLATPRASAAWRPRPKRASAWPTWCRSSAWARWKRWPTWRCSSARHGRAM